MTERIPALGTAAALAGFMLLSLSMFHGAGFDDDIITLWSGKTLGQDWWFINYNGVRSEMTSSILAALVAKLAFLLQPEMAYTLNKLFLFLCAPLALWLPWHYRRSYLSGPYADWLAMAVVGTAAASPVLQYWSMSSLEAPLHTLLLTWYCFLLIDFVRQPERQAWLLVLAQVLLILVRPEGFWAMGVTFCMLLLFHGRAALRPRLALAYLAPAAFFLILLGARYLATGLLFPNAAYAKVAIGENALATGWKRLMAFYRFTAAQGIFAIALAVGAVLAFRSVVLRRAGGGSVALCGLCAVIIAHELFFVIVGGGSGAGMHRLLTPVTVLHACLFFHLLEQWVLPLLGRIPRVPAPAGICLLAALLAGNFLLRVPAMAARPDDRIVKTIITYARRGDWVAMDRGVMQLNAKHRRDIRFMDPFIQRRLIRLLARQDELRIVTYQAGYFPYRIKNLYPNARITFFDTGGLVDGHIGRAASRKNSKGVARLTALRQILTGRHELSGPLKDFNPNMIYALGMSKADRNVLAPLGWKTVYAKPGAVVLFKQKNH